MENIEVGEWIINQNRLVIGQIIGINEERQEATIKVNRLELLIGFWNIRKHSKNIIDLIEVGDVVHTRDVLNEDIVYIWSEEYLKALKEDLKSGIELVDILTHEQYEQNCYKVSNDRTQ